MQVRYNYRLKTPTAKQQETLQRWMAACRWLWNRLLIAFQLEHRYQFVDDFGNIVKIKALKSIVDDFGIAYELLDGSMKTFQNRITMLKESYDWLSEIPIHTLQAPAQDLVKAIKEWRVGTRKFPRRKKREAAGSVYCSTNLFRLNGNRIGLGRKLDGKLQFKMHRDLPSSPSSARILVDTCGSWFVSFVVEIPDLPDQMTLRDLDPTKIVGIDLGIADYLICSDGTKVDNPKFYRRAEKQLKRIQKSFSRKKKGSKNREKTRIKLARKHRQIARRRDGFLHQVAADLLKKYDAICLETLRVSNMIKNHKLAKSIADASWTKFVDILKWKAAKLGKIIHQIGTFVPSSKTCSSCGKL